MPASRPSPQAPRAGRRRRPGRGRVAVGLRRLLGRRHRGHPGRDRVLPAAVRGRSGWPATAPRSPTSPSPARSRTTSSSTSARPRRSPRPTWSSTSAASSRRSTTAVEQNATGEVLDAADVGPATKDARGPPRPALLAGPGPDGRPRRRSSPRSWPRIDPAHADALRANAARLAPAADRPRHGVRRGAGRLRAAHGRGLARRVRLPREVRPAPGADRRPLPRRRAHARRPRPAAGADPRPTASPRSSPSGWAAPG